MLTRQAEIEVEGKRWSDLKVPAFHRYPDNTWPVYSCTWYCPLCFHFWAHLEIQGSRECLVRRSTCEYCIDKWRKIEYYFRITDPVPGSLLTCMALFAEWNQDLMEVLPSYLLKREFDLHLRVVNEGYEP